MEILKVKDSQGVVMATLFVTAPQNERPGWISLAVVRQGLQLDEATEFHIQFGNALAIARGDVKAAA